MQLEGKKVILVPFGDEHLHSPDYLEWLRDYDVVKWINRPEYLRPVSFAEVNRYVQSVWTSESDIFLAVVGKDDDQFVGTVRASQINRVNQTADLGVMIGNRQYWGQGLATDALSLLSTFLFERLSIRRLTAGLLEPNVAVLRVFEKLGFQQEGVFREHDRFEDAFVDHIYLGCFRHEFVPAHLR